MAQYFVGDPIKARLSGYYRARLTADEQGQARRIIRSLRRTCGEGCCASGAYTDLEGGVHPVAVEAGRFNDNSVAGSTATVGEVVCAAVLRVGQGSDMGVPPAAAGEAAKDREESAGKGGADGQGQGDEGGQGDGGGGQGGDKDGEQKGDMPPQEGGQGQGQGQGQSPPPDAAETLLERFWQLREYCERGDEVADIISTRTIRNAAIMYAAGLELEACVHAACLTWPESARDACSVKTIAPQKMRKVPEPRRQGDGEPQDKEAGYHACFPYVLTLARQRIPILMIGPAGTGKGYLARQLAQAIRTEAHPEGLPFGMAPLTEGASVAWLLGRNMPQGYITTDFVECYRSGGVFLFDEIDSGNPNMLVTVNDALENGELHNSINGERIPRHPDFIPVAAANTYGLGADATYTARNRLDGATLDRFRMGRVEMEYDRKLERRIVATQLGGGK